MNPEDLQLSTSITPFSDNIIILAELDQFSQLPFNILSPEELTRSQAIADLSAKTFYLNSKVLLRLLLAKFLKKDPATFQFQYQPSGKPALEGQSIHFNVSHSHQWIGFGFSRHQIGLDIEFTKFQKRNFLAIARRFFAQNETEFLSKLPASDLKTQFFTFWTQKEAMLKAHGGGIKTGLEKIDFMKRTHRISKYTYHVEHAQPSAELHCAVATEHDSTEFISKNSSSYFYILTPTLEIRPLQPPYKQNISLIPESL